MKIFMFLLQAFSRRRLFSRSLRRGGSCACALVLFFALYPVFSVSVAQTSAAGNGAGVSPERVKAAYLYKFLNYIDWPAGSFAQAESPYRIGIVNADGIADELLKSSAGRRVNNRPIVVDKLHAGDSMEGIHVLFIGEEERARRPQLLKQLQSKPVFLVTETEGALAQGSMLNFRLVDERVRFEIALEPVEKSGLKINSRLLAVAISVTKGMQQ